jgi:hypothetical protein
MNAKRWASKRKKNPIIQEKKKSNSTMHACKEGTKYVKPLHHCESLCDHALKWLQQAVNGRGTEVGTKTSKKERCG